MITLHSRVKVDKKTWKTTPFQTAPILLFKAANAFSNRR